MTEPRDRSEALLGIALLSLHVDGRSQPAERRAIREAITALEPLADLDEERVQALEEAVEEAIDTDLADLLETWTDPLREDSAEQAFGLAVDVALADREAAEEERAFLEQLQAALGLPDDASERVVDVLETKHGTSLEPIDAPEPEDDVVQLDISSTEALVAFPLAASYVDHAPDAAVALPPIRVLLDLSPAERDAVLESVHEGLSRWGRGPFLKQCAERLEGDARLQAFSLAAQAALADRRLSGQEEAFLDGVREVLEMSQRRAQRIIDTLTEMHRS